MALHSIFFNLFIILLISNYLFNISNAITLYEKAKSYAIFDVWNITTVGKLELNFRTQSKYCLILYVDDINSRFQYDGQTGNEIGNYLEISLSRGQLQIDLHIKSEKDKEIQRKPITVIIGHNLNDLRWHKLRLTKYVGTLQIQIDDVTEIITISESIATKFSVQSNLFIGGLSEKKKKHSYGMAKLKPRFFGCIEDLKYSSGSMNLSPAIRFLKGEYISPDCMDACGEINPCSHGGKCVNLFTRAGCDCFGTGFNGNRCTRPSETIHVGKSDYIKWNLQDSYSKTHTSTLRLRFKTANKNGLIFYTKRGGNLLLIELVNGYVRVAGGQSTQVPKQLMLEETVYDGDWHNLILTKENTIMTVQLDNFAAKNMTLKITNELSESNEPVYFGGIVQPKYVYGVKSSSNFIGCLQQVEYNKNDVIYKVVKTINKNIMKIGNIKEGCPYNKTNVGLPTLKPTTTLGRWVKTDKPEPKTNIIREIHSREGLGQNVIVWITAAVIVGTIIIMISAACVVHHLRLRHHHERRKPEKDEESGEEQELANKSNESNTDYSSPELTPTMKRMKETIVLTTKTKKEEGPVKTSEKKTEKHDCERKREEEKLLTDQSNNEEVV